MSRYLTDMADVLRAAGLNVIEERGLSKTSGQMIPWQQFGRSSNSQYAGGRPTAVMVHHTVSETAPANDVHYCNVTSDIRPLTNLIIVRSGDVYVCAGGPTNTNGSGHDYWGGGVADNDMNRHAIAIELSNNGVGEPYPDAQQDAVLAATRALCAAYLISPNNARAHFEWAPDRKVDPRGPSRWTAGRNEQWDMFAFRDDVALSSGPPPGDDMPMIAYIAKPPASRAGGPHLVVIDAAVRNATTYDGQFFPVELHIVIDDPAQYDDLLKSANLD